MSSTPTAPLATSAGLRRVLGRARQLSGADAVLLRPASGVDAIAVAGDPGLVARSRTRPYLHDADAGAPGRVPAHELVDGEWSRVVVAVGDDPVATAWLEFARAGAWRPDARIGAVLRVLADLAGCLFDDGGALRDRISQDRIVLTAGRALTDIALVAETFDELLGGITGTMGAILDAGKVGIAAVDERGYLQALPGSFGASPELVASSQVSRDELTTAAGGVFRTGRPKLANDPQTDIPRFFEWVEGFGIERLMTLPMIVSGQPRGVVHVANREAPFTPVDARMGEQITPFVASAVEQVSQRLDMRRKEAVSAVVSRAATAIAAGEHLGHFAGFLDEFRRVLGAARAAIVFADGSAPVTVGRPTGDVGADRAVLDASTGGGVSVRSTMSRPGAPGQTGWFALQAPVLVDGTVQATLSIVRVPYEPFREHERAAVRRVANVAALAMTTDRYRRERAEAAQMRERQRIADDLHDHVAQVLFSGKLSLQAVMEQLDDESPSLPGIVRARDLLVQSEVSIRDVIDHLAGSGSAVEPLVDRLGDAVRDVEGQFGVAVHLNVAAERAAALDALGEGPTTALLVAAREALVNAAKHAGPCRLVVSLRVARSGRAVLLVSDDGRGLPAGTADGYGLGAVRRRLGEHGASLRVRAGRPRGTTVRVVMPLPGA